LRDEQFPETKSATKIREAVRGVFLDEKGLMPILFVSKHDYHKLPGGGIDDGEIKSVALAREMKEETGCEVEIAEEIGEIVEFRSKENCGVELKQISYCYSGKITKKGITSFTEDEIANGFQMVWVTLEKAISILENDKPDNYEGGLIKERDLTFLETAKEIL